ncbi:MAG: hypothetical protein AAF840_09620, partial [Bacteroidota bacterium]
EVFQDTITVLREPEISLDPIEDSCGSVSILPSATVDNNLANTLSYTWDFGPAASPPSSNQLNPGPVSFPVGPHAISLTATNECGSSTESVSFTLYDEVPVSIGPDDSLCVGDPLICYQENPPGGSWFINGISNPDGCVDPVTPGTFEVIYSLDTILTVGNNLLCRFSDTALVLVNTPPAVDAGNYLPICLGDTLFLSQGNPSGGSYFLNGNPVDSAFSPSTSGFFQLDYLYADSLGCENSDQVTVEVRALPQVEAGPPQDLCLANQVVNIAAGANPTGGMWSGPGIVNANTGDFNPSIPGIGSHEVFYDYQDPLTGCSNRDTLTVNISQPQVPTVMADTSLCRNGPAITLMAIPNSSGTWTGPAGFIGPATFDPLNATPGPNELIYTLFAGSTCEASDTLLIKVNDSLPVNPGTLPGSVCIDADTVMLSGFTPLGGTWSGNGIVQGAGLLLPSAAGVGSSLLIYEVVSDSGCVSQGVRSFTVNPLPLVEAGPDLVICNSGGPQQLTGFSPTGAGGTWSGTGISPTGLFDPVLSDTGSFVLTYTFIDANSCENFDTLTVQVIEPDSVSAGSDTTVCVDGLSFINPGVVPALGVWIGTGVNPNTGEFTPSIAGPGLHELIYTVAGGTTCEQRDTVLIRVLALPVVDAGGDLEACVGDLPILLSGGQPTVGGIGSWQGLRVTQQGNDFVFTPDSVGSFTLIYRFQDDSSCVNIDSMTFTVHPLPIITPGPDTTYCITGGLQNLPVFTPGAAIPSGPGVIPSGLFDPVLAGIGTHTLYLDFSDGNGCSNRDSFLVTVIEPVPVDAGPDDSVCLNAGPITLGSFFPLPPAGTWTGTGITDPIQGIFDPAQAGVGVFTLSYCTGTGSCLVCDSLDMTVLPLPNVQALPDSMCITEPPLLLTGGLAYGLPAAGMWGGTGVNSLGGNDYSFGPQPVGMYPISFTFTDSLGCSNTANTTVEVNPQPISG